MLVLTIETATPAEDVAVVKDGRVLAEQVKTVGRGHTETLLASVDDVLARSGVSLSELDAVAVSIGPGRFSGLRVGLATAKGLASAADVPVVAVPTLAALAESAMPHSGLVAPMLDARRGEVYGALFRLDGGSERLLPDAAADPAGMLERVLAAAAADPVVLIGNGASLVAEAGPGAVGSAVLTVLDTPVPTALALAAMAERGTPVPSSELDTLEPVYLRGV